MSGLLRKVWFWWLFGAVLLVTLALRSVAWMVVFEVTWLVTVVAITAADQWALRRQRERSP